MDETKLLAWAGQAMKMHPYPDPRFPPSAYYRFLEVLARELQPQLSVELGVCGGGGSLHLCRGWLAGRVVGVDVSNEYPEQIQYILDNFPNFTFWRGDSVEAAGQVYERYGRVEILFIDTTHTREQTLAEYSAWRPYLAPGAIVLFDDLYRPGMLEAWDELPGRKLRLDRLHDGSPGVGGGFGVIWT